MNIIIQNDKNVPPCAVLQAAKDSGRPFRIFNLANGDRLPDPIGVSSAIILGGDMGTVDDAQYPYLAQVKNYIRVAAEYSQPVLGICLGGQLIADALGGRVIPNKNGERGMKNVDLTPIGCFDPLFETVPYNFTTFQWHDDTFIPPEESALLAVGIDCPRQAFRIGQSIYGLQFHPEVDLQTAKKWAGISRCGALNEEWGRFAAKHEASGKAILENFFKIVCRISKK